MIAGRGLLAPLLVLAVLLAAQPFVSSYVLTLLTQSVIYAIAAMSLDVLLGYLGLASLGHAAYLGVGAYSVGILATRHGAGFGTILLAGIGFALVLAAVFGLLALRATGVYFLMITLALGMVAWGLAYRWVSLTQGDNGISGVPRPDLSLPWSLGDAIPFYYFALAGFLLALGVLWVIVHSPFGKALQAIRDNETRAEFVGVEVRKYRWIAFLVSGAFTGLAGALWVPLNGLTTPDILYWPFSGKIVFLTVLGGFRTFTGPIIGAIAFNYLETYAIGFTVYWQLVLGVVLVLLVLTMPSGIVGTVGQLVTRLRRSR